MEGFLDEVMRRISLCDGLTEEDIEATLQKQLIKSHKLEVPFTQYLRLPQGEQISNELLSILRAKCEIREVFRRNEVERRLRETGFNIAQLPLADGSSPIGRKQNPVAADAPDKKKMTWQERKAVKANAANVAAAAAGGLLLGITTQMLGYRRP